MKEEIKEFVWRTHWGSEIKGKHREGTIDWNTLQAILHPDCDEYFLAKLPLDKQGTAVDIGSYVGAWALATASLGLDTHAVECVPENVEMIKQNVALNNFGSKITVHGNAISNISDAEVRAFYTPDDAHHYMGQTHATLYNGHVVVDPEVPFSVSKTLSLDDLFERENITNCSVVKIDAEGAEWECFDNVSDKTLDKIQFITGEYHPTANKTYPDFINLFRNKFDDISTEYGLETPESLRGFVLQRRS